MSLRGKLVTLRPVEPGDLELMTRWWNDETFLDGGSSRWPVRAMEVEERLKKKPDYDREGEFLILPNIANGNADENAESVQPVGHVGFHTPQPAPIVRNYEFGFGVLTEHRRKGYASSAVRLLINQLFVAGRQHRIQAHCRMSNAASRKVMESAGMMLEGTLRDFVYLQGTHEDVLSYSILRPEWKSPADYAARFDGL